MTKLQEIEAAVASLTREEIAEFREWFEEFDAKIWDAEIDRDAKGGKLDDLARQALDDHISGRTKRL